MSTITKIDWNSRKWLFILAIILVVPNMLYLAQPFYQDEVPTLRNVITFFSEKTIIPHHTEYPTLYSYLAAPVIGGGVLLASVFGYGDRAKETVEVLYFTNPTVLILPARILSLVFLIASAKILFDFVVQRFDKSAAVFAFALTVSSSSLLNYGAYGLPDSALLFFSSLAIIYSIKAIENSAVFSARTLCWAAVFAGLAISSKYNALSVVGPIFIAIIYAKHNRAISYMQILRLCFLTGFICVSAFLIGSPGWILEPGFFIEGFLSVRDHAKLGHLGQTGIPVFGQVELLFKDSPVLLVSAILGLCFIFTAKNQTPGIISAVSVIAIVLLSSVSSKQSVHYMYPGFAGLIILSVYFHIYLSYFSNRLRTFLTGAFLMILFVVGMKSGLTYLNENTTELATKWMYENIPEGSVVTVDWGYVPNIYSHEDLQQLANEYSSAVSETLEKTHLPYIKSRIDYSDAWLEGTQSEYIVTSDGVYDRFFEFGLFSQIEPSSSDGIYSEFLKRRSFYDNLFNSDVWVEIKKFRTGNGPVTIVFKKTS